MLIYIQYKIYLLINIQPNDIWNRKMAGNYCSLDIICSPDPLVLCMMGISLNSVFSHFSLQNWLLFLVWLVFLIFHCNIFFKQLLVVFDVHFVDVAGFIFKTLFNFINVILKLCWKLIPFVVKFNHFYRVR